MKFAKGKNIEELCLCGSSIPRELIYDARGIYLTSACPECRDEKLKKYRRDVLFDPEYYCDEPIDSGDDY
jgi:hypothetical protein